MVVPKDQETWVWYAEHELFGANEYVATSLAPGLPKVGEMVALAVSPLAAIAFDETRTSAAIAGAQAQARVHPAIRRVSVPHDQAIRSPLRARTARY
jgi:hypothetical protein